MNMVHFLTSLTCWLQVILSAGAKDDPKEEREDLNWHLPPVAPMARGAGEACSSNARF
jgi:hypothetical protein